jgi:hypothetical protein
MNQRLGIILLIGWVVLSVIATLGVFYVPDHLIRHLDRFQIKAYLSASIWVLVGIICVQIYRLYYSPPVKVLVRWTLFIFTIPVLSGSFGFTIDRAIMRMSPVEGISVDLTSSGPSAQVILCGAIPMVICLVIYSVVSWLETKYGGTI